MTLEDYTLCPVSCVLGGREICIKLSARFQLLHHIYLQLRQTHQDNH